MQVFEQGVHSLHGASKQSRGHSKVLHDLEAILMPHARPLYAGAMITDLLPCLLPLPQEVVQAPYDHAESTQSMGVLVGELVGYAVGAGVFMHLWRSSEFDATLTNACDPAV
jgi:hypothetical protein